MHSRKTVTLALASVLAAGFATGQDRRPASPAGTAAAQIGDKWIEITYSRPILRGRTGIFGKGAEYGKQVNADAPVWRAGANTTTRLKTEVPLTLGGKTLAPGEYSLFVDLKESGWTLIVSRQPYQAQYDSNEKTATFGAYNYDPKYDVVRVPMKMVVPQVSVDQFTIAFVDMTAKGGKLAMAWERTGAFVEFTAGP